MKENYIRIAKELILKLRQYEKRPFENLISAAQYFSLYELVERWCEPESKILDWGCGNGHFSYFLLKRKYYTYAFSLVSCELSDYLEKRFGMQYVFTKMDKAVTMLPYEDGTFNAVVSVGVLEHVRETGGDEVESLREICRVMKPDGKFICFHLPNRYSWIEFVARNHQYRFARKDIGRMLDEADAELIECRRYAILPRLVANLYPEIVKDSRLFLALYNIVDAALSKVFAPFCQNFYFVAKKRGSQ